MAKKNDREYCVLSCAEQAGQGIGVVQTGPLADRPACEKWIRQMGEPGTAYYIVIFVGSAIYVNVEPTEKRTLAPEPANGESEAPEDQAEREELEEMDREQEEREEREELEAEDCKRQAAAQ